MFTALKTIPRGQQLALALLVTRRSSTQVRFDYRLSRAPMVSNWIDALGSVQFHKTAVLSTAIKRIPASHMTRYTGWLILDQRT